MTPRILLFAFIALLLGPGSVALADDVPHAVKIRYCWCKQRHQTQWKCISMPVEYMYCAENPGCKDPRQFPPKDAPRAEEEAWCYRRDRGLPDKPKAPKKPAPKPAPKKPAISMGPGGDVVRMAGL